MLSEEELRLLEKLAKIEALYAGASTAGELLAAAEAKVRIQDRLCELERSDPPIEYQFSMPDPNARKLFMALLRRYGLKPYRYSRQRYSTVMARVSKGFVDETLWPEYQRLSATLNEYLSEVTERIIAEAIHQDSTEATEIPETKRLNQATSESGA